MSGDKVTFSGLVSTMMAGEPALLRLESNLVKVLGAVDSFRVSGNELTLSSKEKAELDTPMRPQPLICVRDVESSSRWYQYLLGCRGAHGGAHYEQLVVGGELVLQLHAWDVEHHHGPIGDPAQARGNGVLLWFEVEDFDAATARAAELRAEVVLPRHRNPPDGRGGPNHWEIWLKDPDGYGVVLASPYGTADGDWKP